MYRYGRKEPNYLFHKYDFYGNAENWKAKLRDAIDNANPSVVTTGTVEEVAESFVNDFHAEAPELTEGAISVDVEETRVDVSGDFRYAAYGDEPTYVPGIKATYYVPFTGQKNYFDLKPSTWSSVIPAAEIVGSELQFTYERAGQDVAETKRAFDSALNEVKQHLGWLRENFANYNRELLPIAVQRVQARRERLKELQKGTSSLGITIRGTGAASPPPAGSAAPKGKPTAPQATAPSYDVALSFAGEDRPYVEEVAKGLKAANVEVFYDKFETAVLWGKNLIDHLAEIYQHKSKYVVMFVSEHYVSKAWPKHERQNAQARQLLAKTEYILPARFDDSEVPGMTNTVAYLDLRTMKPEELVARILEKLGR